MKQQAAETFAVVPGLSVASEGKKVNKTPLPVEHIQFLTISFPGMSENSVGGLHFFTIFGPKKVQLVHEVCDLAKELLPKVQQQARRSCHIFFPE